MPVAVIFDRALTYVFSHRPISHRIQIIPVRPAVDRLLCCQAHVHGCPYPASSMPGPSRLTDATVCRSMVFHF